MKLSDKQMLDPLTESNEQSTPLKEKFGLKIKKLSSFHSVNILQPIFHVPQKKENKMSAIRG